MSYMDSRKGQAMVTEKLAVRSHQPTMTSIILFDIWKDSCSVMWIRDYMDFDLLTA